MANSGLSLRKWDSSPKNTSDFEMITKFTDLGSMDGKKSVLGIILNVSNKNVPTLSPPAMHQFKIYWRKHPDEGWNYFCEFGLAYDGTNDYSGQRVIRKMSKPPIKNISNIQFRIKGNIRGDFGINDLGVLYRTYRDTSESELNNE